MRDQPYMTSPAPGAEAETVGNPQGGGTLRTQDPNIVRQHIANLNDVIDHPEFEKLPPEQQQQILSARTDAQQQMGQYRDHMQTLSGLPPGMPNFAQINIPEAVKYTGNHIDVARNMLDVAVDGYDSIAQKLKLNDISGGKFNAIRNANKKAWAAYTDATDENLAEAESAVDETNKKMEDLLAKDIHGAVTPKELAGFNQIYGDGQKMLYIGKTIDRAFSGNPMGKEPWEMRGFNGQTMMNGLNALERKFGRPTLDRLLGKGQLDTLYQVARLNLTPAQMGKFGAVISPITKWLGENGVSMRGHVGPGLIAGLIGEATGVGFSKGALVGVSADYAARRVMNAIVTNPRIAEHVIYALDHGVNPKVYGPLIGSMIVQQESAKDQPEEQEQPHP
jgi:hypothetical protein